MATISGKYLDNLRTTMVHEQSKISIETDAPIDNNGLGSRFSPTDLVAAALGSCMITILGIRARTKKIELGKIDFSINKIMTSNPRRISKIEINLNFENDFDQEIKTYLENEALSCPVALSLSENIVQDISFSYNNG